MNESKRSAAAVIPPCILIVAVTYGFARYSFGLFLPEIRHDMGMSIVQAGAAVSTSYFGYLVASLVATAISGRTGPKMPVVLGGVLATTGLLVASFATSSSLLIAGLFVAGMSPGLSYPPLSDAITRMVVARDRDWIYTSINSGTSIGIVISAPVALFFVADWRLCLFSFAVIAALVTIWNLMIMPSGPFIDNSIHARWPVTFEWMVNRRSIPLYLSAFLFGISSSIYWVFSPELLINNQGLSKYFTTIFWLFIGLSGLLGAGVGGLLRQVGLRMALLVTLGVYSVSLILFAFAPSSAAAALASASLFGAAFIAVTGIFGVWSMYVFPERPSAGFGAVFLLISIGQFFAPVVGGRIAEEYGMEMLFAGACVIGMACLFFLPDRALKAK